MKRLSPSILMAVLLLSAFTLGLSSQVARNSAETILATIQPLLVDIQQQVPVSVTLAVPVGTTGTQTVTMPLMLDLILQIGLADTVTATVDVGEVTSAKVEVSTPLISEENVDDLGIPYAVTQEGSEVEITEWTTYKNQHGRFSISGESAVTDEAEPLDHPTLVVRFYDVEGNLFDVQDTTLFIRAPGNAARFAIYTTLDPDNIGSYMVEVKVRR